MSNSRNKIDIHELASDLGGDDFRLVKSNELILAAYSDCLHGNNDSRRNLNMFCKHPYSIDQAMRLLSVAIPRGYNDFCGD